MLSKFIHNDLIFIGPSIKSTDELFDFIAKKAVKKGFIERGEVLKKGLVDREAQGTTELKPGIAIPHAKLETIKDIFVMIFILKDPIKFSPGIGKGVGLFFMIGAPKMDNRYINVLGSIARLIETPDFISELHQAGVVEDVIFSLKNHSVMGNQNLEEGKNRYLVTLSLNVKFSISSLLAMFLEVGIYQPILYEGENLSVKRSFGLSTFGVSILDVKGTMANNKTIQGIADDKESIKKLYKLLCDEGIDLEEKGAGSLHLVELQHCFGGHNIDIDF